MKHQTSKDHQVQAGQSRWKSLIIAHHAPEAGSPGERSFSWIVRWRRLCRDHEGLPESSEALIKLSASYRMLTKLAPAFP